MPRKKAQSGKRAAKAQVPKANPGDVYDDPGPTRAFRVEKKSLPPLDVPWNADLGEEAEEPAPRRARSPDWEPAGKAEAGDAGEADAADVYDDPGPTKAVAKDGEPEEAEEADVHDDPGPTKAVPLEEEPELDPSQVHDDPGPTKALPSTRVLDEIETEMALGRISEVKELRPKKAKKKR